MTEMSPISNRLSIRYLDNFSADEDNSTNEAPSAAPEAFQNNSNNPTSSAKTHQHSKEKIEQNESSNDASNETSDTENHQNPLTSRNLEAQNKENQDRSNKLSRPDSTSITSPPTGGGSTGKSGQSTEATSTEVEPTYNQELPKKFLCKVCNQGFTRKHNMVSHEMIHSTIKLHRCSSCNLSFRRIHDLKRHEKLHTGEKPYHCDKCARGFARPDALTRHLNSPHACTGSKEPNENPQCTQTSNTSSSSYQASKLIEASQAADFRTDELPHGKERSFLHRLGKSCNEEQSLPLGSESSSASLLPTGKLSSMSNQDSEDASSGVDGSNSQTKNHSSGMRYYAPYSSFSGDSNDSSNATKPNFEINMWRSQQMHTGEQISENIVRGIMQKQPFSTNSTSVISATDEVKSVQEPNFPNQLPDVVNLQRTDPQDQQYYRAYSPFHRSSVTMNNMATLNKAMLQNPGRNSATEVDSKPGLRKSSLGVAKNTSADINPLQREVECNSLQQAPPVHKNQDPFAPPQQQYAHGVSLMQQSLPQLNVPYNTGVPVPPFLPLSGTPEGWQGPSPGNIARPGSSGRQNWPDNLLRSEGPEQRERYNYSPEFVRAEAYYELQNHANGLQHRISSLELRMEMLEEKMKRENKNSVKLQKRQEKRSKKKTKKVNNK